MAKIKRLINFGLPVSACNMRCSYCYVSQVGWDTKQLGQLDYSVEHIQRCLTVERLGGVCHINMCGSGETLLPDYTLELAEKFLENGHYVSIVTNGTLTNRIEQLCNFNEEYKSRLFVKFSLHYFELKRSKLLNKLFDNIRFVKKNNISFSIELGADDSYLPYIDEIKAICEKEVGSAPHVIELRRQYDLEEYARLTELPLEQHIEGFQKLNTSMFNFQQKHWGEKRTEFCYAGEWIIQLDAKSGWFVPCFIGGEHIQNIYENPDEPINFVAMGCNCPWKHCYSAHILLTSGTVPSLETPTYASFRDGTFLDGSSWLGPKVAEFFSSKLIESNNEYSQEKKEYINALMAMQYKNREYKWNTNKIAKILENALVQRAIKTVALIGTNIYTDWLLMHLMQTSIEVKYIVDTNEQTMHIVAKPNNLLPVVKGINDDLSHVDAAIVTEYAYYDDIKKNMPVVYDKILSLVELVE